ncbi:MAG: riboflavin synthase [Cyanobacteriota bacterium]
MFTGIIEEIGKINKIEPVTNGIKLTVIANIVLQGLKLGDSISINGACQTVISFSDSYFTVEVSPETLNVTTFKYLKLGDNVNLERALKLSDRLGGHLVNGHVDSVGELIDIKNDGFSKIISFKAPEEVAKYLVYKGSVCIDGISLTIADLKLNGKEFSVAVIPHTLQNTTLLSKKSGQKVNLEVDIIAKYVEKLLKNSNNEYSSASNITYNYLIEHGFA